MIRYFVGVPGSGKTTLACKIMKKEMRGLLKNPFKKKYKYIFSNFDNDLSNIVNARDLSEKATPDNSLLMIDESGIEFNCRDYKNFDKGLIEFFKYHRHYKTDVCLFSQTFDDVDKVLRDLSSEIWIIRKLGPLTYARCVYKRVGIDDITKELKYQHYFKSILWQLLPFMPPQFIFCFRPLYYKHFNSYSKPNREIIQAKENIQSTLSSYITRYLKSKNI